MLVGLHVFWHDYWFLKPSFQTIGSEDERKGKRRSDICIDLEEKP